MRHVDADIAALLVAGRDEIKSRRVIPEQRIDEGVIVRRRVAPVDPDAGPRPLTSNGASPNVGEVVKPGSRRARLCSAVEKDVAAAVAVIDLVVTGAGRAVV